MCDINICLGNPTSRCSSVNIAKEKANKHVLITHKERLMAIFCKQATTSKYEYNVKCLLVCCVITSAHNSIRTPYMPEDMHLYHPISTTVEKCKTN